jgi:TPP-dependent pyruvate/acetoin dehydrogenase alpha subunit
VFVCRNNGGTGSTPGGRQTAAKTFAAKAVGYGMPGVRVDGNDLLAVWQVAREAIDRARAGGGPTLIEALTRRSSATDAPDRADGDGEPAALTDHRDPLHRLRNYLRHRGLWSERREAELAEQYHREIHDALAAAERKRAPAVETLFDDVYEQPAWNLREQRAYLLAQPRRS